MFHLNALLKATSVEENFNQVGRMTHFVDVGQPHSPSTPTVAQWAHNVATSGGMRD